MLYKNTLIKIKRSFGRFISLFIIVMVGVGFFAGIKESSPDITAVLSDYNRDYKLMDFQIVSTMGMTDDDVAALKSLNNVSEVIPSYSLDVLAQGKTIRIHALEDAVNTVKLIDGQMPRSEKECVADSRSYHIGDKISITSDISESLKNTEYTVVGIVSSPLYLSYEYGNTTVGDGKLSSFLFINKDNFTMDVYTQIYVKGEGVKNLTAYSKDYDDFSSELSSELVELKTLREEARYQEIYKEATDEIIKNENTLKAEKQDGEKQLEEAKALLDENAKKLSYAKDELDRNTDGLQNQVQAFGLSKHSTQYENVESELEKASEELTKNQKQWDEANQEYTESLETFQKKISDAEAKIQDAKDTLASMEKPKWIIFDRNTAVAGFSEMKDITETVSSIAKIFPLFFILIVLLMTSNTMARMIVEERGELGTLTSLGFKDRSIISMYLLYVLSATVLGAATGYIIGCNVIPHIIYLCLPYSMPSLVIHYNVESFLIIILVVIALMSTVTILFCNHELKNNPSTLMRPIPPKNGKTILLERISFIWNRLSFTWKVTIRNMFRYKQRVLMTIVGVAGCTALLLTGFGVRDSINGIAEKQYGEILRYNALIVLKNETQTITNDMMDLLEKEQIQEPSLIHQSAVTCELKDKSLNTYLIVPEKEENFYKYFNLKSDRNGDKLKLSDEGVLISQKLSEVYKIGKGDQIEVKDSDNNSFTMPVLDVTENYMQNYIYISKNLYEKVFGETPLFNMIVSDFAGDGKIVSQHLMDSGLAANVTYKADILKKAVESNKSLNNVVLLLVCISSMLAVIVLYNLTSINISERKREIATLKVLGFTDKETNEYIYREAFVLSLISIGVGLLLGIGVHQLVIDIIEKDSIVLFKSIKGLSYLWSFLITITISFIMQIITYFILKKINMIESLKSVE